MFEKLFLNSGLSLPRLKIFCEIAEAGGVTKAAAGRTHGQGHYSRELKQLEKFFETQLFDRRGKGMQITSAGKLLLPITKEYLNSLEQIVGELKNLPRQVSIGAGESILDWLVLPRFAELRKILQNTSIELINLRSEAINTRVLEGELDFGIVRASACSPELGTAKLGTLHYCLFVPKPLVKQAKTSDPIQLLQRLPLARLSGDGEFNQMLDKLAKQKRLRFQTSLLCSSFPAMKEAVKRGFTAAVLPTIAETDLPKSDFEKFDIPIFSTLDRPFVVSFNKRQLPIRPFLDGAIERLSKLLRL